MIKSKCISDVGNSGECGVYTLVNTDTNTKVEIKHDDLMSMMLNNEIEVDILTLLFSDNSSNTRIRKIQPRKYYVSDILKRVEVVGGIIEKLTLGAHQDLYVVSTSENKHMLLIPDNVPGSPDNVTTFEFNEKLRNLRGTLKVVGGKNIRSLGSFFSDCVLQEIDFSMFTSDCLTNLTKAFNRAELVKLDMSCIDTSKVESTSLMLSKAYVKDFEMPRNLERLKYAGSMFEQVTLDSPVDFADNKLERLTLLNKMFYLSSMPALYMGNVDIDSDRVSGGSYIFGKCNIDKVELTGFLLDEYNSGQLDTRWHG